MASHDEKDGKRPGSRRSPVVLILAVLGGCGLLGVLGLVGAMLLARRELGRIDAHFEAIQRAADAAGQPVPDPTPPAGSLEVQLVPASPELHLEQIATLQIRAQVATWERSPVRFDHIGSDPWAIAVAGPYVVEPVSVRVPPGGDGAQVAVRAIPVDSRSPTSPTRSRPGEGARDRFDAAGRARSPLEAGRHRLAMDLFALARGAGGARRLPRGAVGAATGALRCAGPEARSGDGSHRAGDAVRRGLPLWSRRSWPIERVMEVSGQSRRVAALHVSVQPRPRPRPRAEPCPPADSAPAWKGRAPRVSVRAVQNLPGGSLPAVVEGVAATSEAEVLRCYLDGLRREPKLEGRVSVRFVIGRDGAVSNVQARSDELTDAATLEGIRHAFEALTFPQPAGGIVTVTYPFVLATRR